jgi:hypothetical protein
MRSVGLVVRAVLLSLAPAFAQAPESFHKAKLSRTQGENTKQIDVTITYGSSTLEVRDKKTQAPLKSFDYETITGAEYSYAKSPRGKAGIFASSLLLFTSGKKHWMIVQGANDYALLQLDNSNYRTVLAAFEARTGIEVETVEDRK